MSNQERTYMNNAEEFHDYWMNIQTELEILNKIGELAFNGNGKEAEELYDRLKDIKNNSLIKEWKSKNIRYHNIKIKPKRWLDESKDANQEIEEK